MKDILYSRNELEKAKEELERAANEEFQVYGLFSEDFQTDFIHENRHRNVPIEEAFAYRHPIKGNWANPKRFKW